MCSYAMRTAKPCSACADPRRQIRAFAVRLILSKMTHAKSQRRGLVLHCSQCSTYCIFSRDAISYRKNIIIISSIAASEVLQNIGDTLQQPKPRRHATGLTILSLDTIFSSVFVDVCINIQCEIQNTSKLWLIM